MESTASARSVSALLFAALLVVLPLAHTGCSKSKKVTETTEVEVSEAPEGEESESEEPVRKTTKTTTTEESDSGGCGGVLSCTVGFVGDVIALPFRAVGGLIDIIF